MILKRNQMAIRVVQTVLNFVFVQNRTNFLSLMLARKKDEVKLKKLIILQNSDKKKHLNF